MSQQPPPQVQDKTKRTKIFDWTVPLKIGAAAGAIAGTLFWTPRPGGRRPPWPSISLVGRVILVCIGIAVSAGGAHAVRARPDARARGGGLVTARRPADRGRRSPRGRRAGRGERARAARGDGAGARRVAEARRPGRSCCASASRSRSPSARSGCSTRAAGRSSRATRSTPAVTARAVAVRLRSRAPRRRLHRDLPGHLGRLASRLGRLRVQRRSARARRGRRSADLLAGQNPDRSRAWRSPLVRALQFGAIALGIGALACSCWPGCPGCARPSLGAAGRDWRSASAAFAAPLPARCWSAPRRGRRARRGAALPLQAATAEGTSVWSALGDGDPRCSRRASAWSGARRSSPGSSSSCSPGAAGRRAGAAARDRRRDRLALPGPGASLALLAVPLLALAFLPGLGGHAGVQAPVARAPARQRRPRARGGRVDRRHRRPRRALPAATRRLEPANRTRLLAAVMPRFSTLALVAVIALLAGGILQSVLMLDVARRPAGHGVRPRDPRQGVLVLVLVAARARCNRRRILPGAGARGRGRHVARPAPACCCAASCGPRSALGVAALVATGALAGYAPADAQPTGPYSAHARRSARRAPSSPSSPRGRGRTRSTCTCSTAATGASTTRRRSSASRPRCPSAASSRSSSRPEGRARALRDLGAPLSPPGDWRLEVVARVSDFDELRTSFKVPIR